MATDATPTSSSAFTVIGTDWRSRNVTPLAGDVTTASGEVPLVSVSVRHRPTAKRQTGGVLKFIGRPPLTSPIAYTRSAEGCTAVPSNSKDGKLMRPAISRSGSRTSVQVTPVYG